MAHGPANFGRDSIGIVGHRQAENTLHRDAADRPMISAAVRSFILKLVTQTMARPSTFMYMLSMVRPTARLGHQPNMYRASVGRIDNCFTCLGFQVPTSIVYMWAEGGYHSGGFCGLTSLGFYESAKNHNIFNSCTGRRIWHSHMARLYSGNMSYAQIGRKTHISHAARPLNPRMWHSRR